MNTRTFASDNNSGVHPEVLKAIETANVGHAPAYGDDHWTALATSKLCAAFDADAQVYFCFGGTGANVLGLAAVTRPHQAILCAESAHLWNSEGGAPERFTGAKLIPLANTAGKLAPATVAPHLVAGRGVHTARPRVLSITQPTEFGTLYTLDEIRVLAEFAHAHDLLLHVDGARFANAVAALGCSLHDAAPAAGIDILSFGGTKNGLLGAEAVIFFNRALAIEAGHARKQVTQLASKMRFLAAQFIAYLDAELWRELATRANHMAQRLAAGCGEAAGVEICYAVECNMVFPRLPRAALDALLAEFYFYTWDEARNVARWITSFDTSTDDVDALIEAVHRACSVSRI